ncbi:MAG: hypothetical protein H6Q20_789 [Bacteroidetes bacterium]|nr:hypothetical protein [Bacteroidota bacterium]
MNSIVIIGAGNVATHISQALQKSGFKIIQIYSRTQAAAKTLANILNASYTSDIESICRTADLYLYALKDNALEFAIKKVSVPEALHVHTAGSVPISVFEHVTPRYGVLYPLQTFSKTKHTEFNNVPVLVEGNNPETTDVLMSIAQKISTNCYPIDSEQRAALHLAAVFCCNFVNSMYNVAEKIVSEAGLPFNILQPLIDETAEKIHHLLPAQAQTGPAVRYDTKIIEKHLEMLNGNPQLQHIYREISSLIFDMRTK